MAALKSFYKNRGYLMMLALGFISPAAAKIDLLDDPIQVNASLYYSVWPGLVAIDQRTSPTRSAEIKTDGRLLFDTHRQAFDSFTLGAAWRINLEANKVENRFGDRIYLYASDDWGRVEFGNQVGASYKFLYRNFIVSDYAPAQGATPGLNGGGLNGLENNGPFEANYLTGANANGRGLQNGYSALAAGLGNLAYLGSGKDSGNATKLSYFSPKWERIWGSLQLGISVAPEGLYRRGSAALGDLSDAASPAANQLAALASDRSLSTMVETGALYSKQLGDLELKIGAGFSYAPARAAPDVGLPTHRRYHDLISATAAAQATYPVLFGLVKFSAAVTADGISRLPERSAAAGILAPAASGFYQAKSAEGYALGLEYLVDPFVVGGYYHHGRSAGSPFQPGSDLVSDGEIGVSYKLSREITISTTAYLFDYHDDGALLGAIGAGGSPTSAADGGPGHNRSGAVYLLGGAVAF